jgi:drug/metabolite transporter (DMT)-like permease
MRHGQATRVSSILYLPPIVAVAAEWLVYRIIPTPLTFVGMVIVCAGVWLAQATDN